MTASPEPERSLLATLLRPRTPEDRARLREVEAGAVAGGVVLGNLLGRWLCPLLPEGSFASVVLWWPLFLVQAFALHLAVLLLGFAVVAGWTGRRRLMAGCLAAAAFSAAPWVDEFVPAQQVGPGPGRTLRVATANLLGISRDHDALVEELAAWDPQVLLLVEYTAPWHRALFRRLGSRYPYREVRLRQDAFGMALYSKFPLSETEPAWLEDWANAPQLRATLDVGGRRLHLLGIHTMPPRTPEYTRYHRGMVRRMMGLVGETPDPLILLGDFNFGVNTPQQRALLGAGFVDAASAVGAGPAGTWPVLSFLRHLPGMRLDHVYVRGNLGVVDFRTGEGRGSDHRPIMADLLLP